MQCQSWRPRKRAGSAVCIALAALAFPGSAGAAAGWSIVSSPNPSASGPQLLAVGADAAADGWGVGVAFNTSTKSYLTLAEHWNGTAWTIAPTPNPMRNQQLNGVAAVSPTNAWAVGFANNSQWAANRNLIVHWDGRTWSAAASPNPSSGENDLWGVWAASATDVWAVGEYSASGGAKTLAVHWNGSTWSVTPTPNPTSYANLHRVFGTSSNDVWAVGTAYDSTTGEFAPLTEHWNGSTWTIVPSPALGESYLRGGWATSARDAWIVGEWDGPAPTYTPHQLIYHWNGTSWTSVSSPSGSGYELDGVTAKSATDAWIVGVNSVGNGRRTLIEHWDGTSWSLVSSPNKAGASDLYAVTMVPTGLAWAVGDGGGGTLIERTLTG